MSELIVRVYAATYASYTLMGTSTSNSLNRKMEMFESWYVRCTSIVALFLDHNLTKFEQCNVYFHNMPILSKNQISAFDRVHSTLCTLCEERYFQEWGLLSLFLYSAVYVNLVSPYIYVFEQFLNYGWRWVSFVYIHFIFNSKSTVQLLEGIFHLIDSNLNRYRNWKLWCKYYPF